MKVVFFGTPSFVVPVLEALNKHYDVVAVVTAPDAPSGRNQELKPSPVKIFAQANNIRIIQPQSLEIACLPARQGNWKLEIGNCDVIVVASYGQIIPKDILGVPKHALNIHPSLLPKYRGPSPVQTTLLNGDKETGVTIIEMDEEVDHGAILLQKPYPVESHDTFESLVTKLFIQSAKLIINTIEDIAEGEIIKKPQRHEDATFTDHLSKQSGFIDLTNPPDATRLDRMIRAYYPWPGVWTRWQMANGKERIVKFLPDKQVQVEGKNPMSVKDAINGYPELKGVLEKLFLNS